MLRLNGRGQPRNDERGRKAGAGPDPDNQRSSIGHLRMSLHGGADISHDAKFQLKLDHCVIHTALPVS